MPLPSAGNSAANPPTPPTDFFYALGNSPSNPAFETGTPAPTTYYPVGTTLSAYLTALYGNTPGQILCQTAANTWGRLVWQ